MSMPRCRVISALISAIVFVTPTFAQQKNAQWRQFRGPNGLGVTSANLPTTWGPSKNIAWKTELPGPGTSSPVVTGDQIFLTCYTGYNIPGEASGSMDDLRLHLLCLKRSNGKIVWKRTVTPKLPEQGRIRESHGYASSTPVVDDKRVYVFFGKTGVFAFDHAGKEQWRASVGSRISGWGSAASPLLFGDLLIVNASVESGDLVALDKRTGKEKWRASGIREAWNTPLLMTTAKRQPELIVPILRQILAFDPSSGKKLWWCDTGITWYMVPSAVAGNGIVYSIGGRSGVAALAVRSGGRGDVTETHRLWMGKKGSNVSSPILHDGHLYWMHDNLGIAFCADAKTGKIVYQERIPRSGQIYASPVLADGKLYFVSRSGRTFVIAAQPRFKLLAVNELEERGRFNASPAVADRQLLLRSNRYLYCIGKR